MKILGIKVNGFRLLEDKFYLDLRTRARVTSNDYEDEVINIAKNIDIPASIALVGKNSSGKSTVYNLLLNCYELLKDGQLIYNHLDFKREKIILSVVFGDSENTFLYKVTINKPQEQLITIRNDVNFCLFSHEELCRRLKPYEKHEDLFSGFGEDILNSHSLEGGSRITSLSQKKSFGFDFAFIPSSLEMSCDSSLTEFFFSSLSSDFKSDLISLLDDSIEYIKPIPNTDDFEFKRKGTLRERINQRDLNYILSDGTKRGLNLFASAFFILKKGGTLLVDEIEGSFHRNLVNNIIYLFNENKINTKKANLIFTTHYSEILDSLRRRDPIFICHKNKEGLIGIKNVYSDYKKRCELSKSKQFNNNVFDTLLNYDTLVRVRNDIRNEISDSD